MESKSKSTSMLLASSELLGLTEKCIEVADEIEDRLFGLCAKDGATDKNDENRGVIGNITKASEKLDALLKLLERINSRI